MELPPVAGGRAWLELPPPPGEGLIPLFAPPAGDCLRSRLEELAPVSDTMKPRGCSGAYWVSTSYYVSGQGVGDGHAAIPAGAAEAATASRTNV